MDSRLAALLALCLACPADDPAASPRMSPADPRTDPSPPTLPADEPGRALRTEGDARLAAHAEVAGEQPGRDERAPHLAAPSTPADMPPAEAAAERPVRPPVDPAHAVTTAPPPATAHTSVAADRPACPPGTRADPVRADLLRSTALRTAAGREVLLAAPDTALCFGGAARGTLQGRVIVLADSLPIAAAAARLTHQLAHLADGLDRFPAPDTPCDRQLAAALTAEARGIAAEVAVWDALGRPADPPYSFAATVLAAAPTERIARVRALLTAEAPPDGLDALVRDYRDRCARPRNSNQ